MCSGPSYTPPPPPPAAPPTLDQLAPKSASKSETAVKKKKSGLSRYRMDATGQQTGTMRPTGLGSIPKKTGSV